LSNSASTGNGIRLIYPTRRGLSHAARAFLEVVRGKLGRPGPDGSRAEERGVDAVHTEMLERRGRRVALKPGSGDQHLLAWFALAIPPAAL